MKKISNYEKCIADWQQRFVSMDHEELLKRIPSLKRAERALTITHFGKEFFISTDSGKITSPQTGNVSQNEQFNIYTLLWYCSPSAHFRGDWVPFASLKNAGVFGSAFQKNVLDTLARTFSGQTGELEKALRKLGGQKLAVGDVGYEIRAFEEIPVRVIFWDADDEFPAQANLLFDKSAVEYIHVESIVTIASVCLDRLSEISGLPLNGNAFGSAARV